ncbi:MAG: hypothetical protein L6R38_002770 [Xanthoria sp. 2 TBL-2021]|nr:MAG: hypothetical protein L6R38_002770 [Xanthoria sp. 2 TBL-2021]
MSLRISTVRAKVQAAKTKLNNLGHPPSEELTDALGQVEAGLRFYKKFCSQTEYLGPTFNTLKTIKYLAEDAFDPKLEYTTVWGQVCFFHYQSDAINSIAEGIEALRTYMPPNTLSTGTSTEDEVEDQDYPPHEYITSLITYTVRSADQGYYRTGVDDEGEVDYTSPRAIGPEYQRLLTHKTALEGLSTLLNQQTVTLSKHKEAQLEQRSRLGWWGNMVNISGKVSQWSKETKWVDSAFVKQEQLANAWTPGP